MTNQAFENHILYLIGYPGTGKYTLAKEFHAQMPHFKLVDNHLINNVLFPLIYTDGVTPLPPRIWENVGKIWDAVVDTVIYISPPDYSFILTNALSTSEADRAWFDVVCKMAEARQAVLVPVALTVSVEEHKKRIVSEERHARFKETDPEGPEKYAKAQNMLIPEHPNTLVLDISDLSPSEIGGRDSDPYVSLEP